eukprot:COSAG01_NODE_1110_length_11657_cov_5.360616_8_plen_104_part_00
MRSTWKLRKKVVTVIKSEVTGARRGPVIGSPCLGTCTHCGPIKCARCCAQVTGGRRKSGMTWDEFFQAEWVKNNGVRAQLDVAKSKVSCSACGRRNRCAAPTQ